MTIRTETGMHAALVTSFDRPPHYENVDAPHATGDGEVVVDVLAAALHNTVRGRASGRHYAAGTELPLIPGVDAVGRLPDGQRVYFLALDSAHGTMADQTIARRSRCVPLPDAAGDLTVAAGVNPAMSSWVPLRLRVGLQPGQRVLVLGATGTAGRAAVQIAKRLGAAWVTGVGRDPGRLSQLRALGADAVVSLAGSATDVAGAVRAAAEDIDVVIDYLWGEPAETVMPAVLAARPAPDKPLYWLQIGAMAGPAISLLSVALRSHNLMVLGSGQGAISAAEFLAEIPALIGELAAGTVSVDALQVPLHDVEKAWDVSFSPEKRIVFVP
jgi:NADPH:quinone reductase-like Zn-dependent oxidoreductase